MRDFLRKGDLISPDSSMGLSLGLLGEDFFCLKYCRLN